MRAALTSVLGYVLLATFVGIGALAHDGQFSLGWALLASLLIWAGPAQVILITSLTSGATVVQAALAVTISAIRLMPMVVSILPMIRTPKTKLYQLALPAHFVAVTFWVEGLRLLPHVPREWRIAFANGLGTGLTGTCVVGTAIGYLLAAKLPPIFGAGVLALTPLTFLYSTILNAKQSVDRIALVLGLALYPAVALLKTGADILIVELLRAALPTHFISGGPADDSVFR